MSDEQPVNPVVCHGVLDTEAPGYDRKAPRKKWTPEMKERMRLAKLKLYNNPLTDPRRKKAREEKKKAIQRRRQRARVNDPKAQRQREASLHTESPEQPQLPAAERGSPGTGLAWKRQYNLLPADVRQELEQFRAQVIADLGGESELSAIKQQYVQRLAQIDTIINLVILDLNTRGLLTVKGKVRSTVDALFKAVDRYDKLAQRLGLERRTKKVPTSIEEFMSQPDGVIDIEPSDDDNDDA